MRPDRVETLRGRKADDLVAFGRELRKASGRSDGNVETKRAGWLGASPRNAALTVAPVAIPSYTTMIVRPSTATGERSST